MTVNQYMTNDHRMCDEEFASLENIIDSGNFEEAKELFHKFHTHMLNHFSMEENVMFPQFNSSQSEGCNPTGVMIMEHDQMRNLMEKMDQAIQQTDQNQFLGLSENLLFVMQQHNMKEEQIMYNLVDEVLDSQKTIQQMESFLA